MRTSLIVIALGLAAAASAQEAPARQPDYSKDHILQLLANAPEPPAHTSPFEFHFGSVEFPALGTRWRFNYLPIMMPFSGSFNTGRGLGSNIPDPFALTGTTLPYTARTWRDNRALSSELKRIERTEREKERSRPKATVVATPEQ